MALHALLDRAAEEYPGRTAIIFRNWKMSYAALRARAEAMAAALRRLGLKRGERVSVMLPNLPQTIITFWAILKAGGVVVMTNPLYMESELTHQLGDADCRIMVTLDHLWPRIAPLRNRLPVEKFIITRVSDCLGFPLNLLYRFKAQRDGLPRDVPLDNRTVLAWKELARGRERVNEPVADPLGELALLQYTGGTTGVSKGVMLTHANMVANVRQCHAMLHDLGRRPEVFLGLPPYFHVYGLTVCLLLGTAVAATMLPFPRYVPQDLLDAIEKLRPTIFPGAPSVYISLMQQKGIADRDLSSLTYCVSGSAPMPVEILRRFEEKTGAIIAEGYGLTEASPVTHLNPLHGERKVGGIGLPLPGTEARIVDMEVGSIPLPPGKVGELVIRGPQVMRGYWNRPDETAGALRNGWLYTGDIAVMDEQGYFTIVDRKKDMVIIGGYNVYPREIDEVLHTHPKVLEAVCVGMSHPTRGESLKAFVVVKPGEELTRPEVIAWCRQKLANYKVPRQVEFRDDLPKSIVGKVLRRALKEEEDRKQTD
ncbi:MAG: long-chain fatty acid--CoA ligase [Desulfovibrionaceae bacterium]